MQATSPTFYGTVTLNGSIVCAPTTGRKIDIYSDGATIYGFGLNDFEFCVFGGAGSAFSYRIAKEGATDLAGDLALFVNSTGVGIPVGRPISWGANTLLVDATGALLVNGAAAVSRAGAVTLAFDPGAVAADGTYVLVGGAPYPLTVVALEHETATGSFTVAVNNGATAVAGLGAVAVDSPAKASVAATGNAAVPAGGRVTAVVSDAAGSPSGAVLTLRFDRA